MKALDSYERRNKMKKQLATGILGAAALAMLAISPVAAEDTTYPLEITDDLGNQVTFEEAPETIVSLSPAATEIVYAIGAGDKVVGRTDYCDYPQEVADVDSIGSYAEPNMELIIEKAPDVIFVSDYIDDSIRSQVEAIGTKVFIFSANDIEAVENDIQAAGQILNLNDEAKEVTDGMEADRADLKETLSGKEEEKSVFIDIGSYYSAGPGSLLDSLLKEIQAENVAEDTGETWPQLSVERIIEKDPNVYVSLYTKPEELKEVSGLADLDCIANDNIVYFDGLSNEANMMQRPGPRLVQGAKILAESIYPELFADEASTEGETE